MTTGRTEGMNPSVSSEAGVTGAEIRLFEWAALFSLSLIILVISKQLLCNELMLGKAASSPPLQMPTLLLKGPYVRYFMY